MDSSSPDVARPLNVVIIGAGIAGLTCALALRKKGHTVTLLERSKFSAHTETGAAIIVAPNASCLLRPLGWDPVPDGCVLMRGARTLDAQGNLEHEADLAKFHTSFKSPCYLAHRVDLHRDLKRLAVESGAELVLGVKIAEVDAERGVVREDGAEGRVWKGDVVLGADGNKSIAREKVEPSAKLIAYGKSAYRWLVDMATLKADPETAFLAGKEGYFTQLNGPDRKIILYPCRNSTLMNVAAFVPTEEAEEKETDWLSHGSKAKLLQAFSSFGPAAHKLISFAADDLKVWQLMEMSPLSHYNKSKLALIGDAAHPFLPFLGEGGAIAMEDAASAATLLDYGTKPEDVPELLHLYDDVRRERANLVMDATRKIGLDPGEGQPPPSFMMEMLSYCYAHDEFENSTLRLKEWKQQRQIGRQEAVY